MRTYGILWLLAVSALFCCGMAQARLSEPLVQEGRQWATRIYVSINPNLYNTIHTEIYRIEDDTILDNKIYKKIYCYLTPEMSDGNLYRYACRQENDKVFLYFYGQQAEVLFLDFSLKHGDLFEEEGRIYAVSEIRDTLLPGDDRLRKCMILRDTSKSMNRKTWVEGIGSLDKGIFWQPYDWAGSSGTLLCCHQSSRLLYQNQDYNSCFVGGLAIESAQENPAASWRLSPQPTRDRVRAVCEATEPGLCHGRWRLYDRMGKTLQVGSFADGVFELSLAGYANGLYLVEIVSDDGAVCRLKCIKTE